MMKKDDVTTMAGAEREEGRMANHAAAPAMADVSRGGGVGGGGGGGGIGGGVGVGGRSKEDQLSSGGFHATVAAVGPGAPARRNRLAGPTVYPHAAFTPPPPHLHSVLVHETPGAHSLFTPPRLKPP